jgi:hypothetical protein
VISSDRIGATGGLYIRVHCSHINHILSVFNARGFNSLVILIEVPLRNRTYNTETAVRHSSVNKTLHEARFDNRSKISLLSAMH